MNFTKYNPPRLEDDTSTGNACNNNPVPESHDTAKESDQIAILTRHLADHHSHGLFLAFTDGGPALRFEPGLRKGDDPERWRAARHAVALMFDAEEEIRKLIARGAVRSPEELTIMDDPPAAVDKCEMPSLFDRAGPP